jgi:ParB-like chromosome segregation protein Spo0J
VTELFDFAGSTDSTLLQEAEKLFTQLPKMSFEDRVATINALRMAIHKHSPFSSEPVDYVQWVKTSEIAANDYNPNSVAPPEMKLLVRSILQDGYTQPIVAWLNGAGYEVVDGFHRNRVGRENEDIAKRIHGYLPLAVINTDRAERGDRMAATIRHNRARGKHKVEGMSDIVVELKRRNWSDERIGRELGMEQDEVLRLCQITGLADLFSDQEFSKSWDVEGEVNESDFQELTDDVSTFGEEATKFRTVNTSDESRIFHTYDKWECYKSGFYDNFKTGMTKQECEEAYRVFLADIPKFADTLEHVITEWKHSCEHYLTNVAMNRIAWLGQAAASYAIKIPSVFRSGFNLLTEEQQKVANETALTYLNKWLLANNRTVVSMAEAMSYDRQSVIY